PRDGHYDERMRHADLILYSGLGSAVRDPASFLETSIAADGSFGTVLGHGLWTTERFRTQLRQAAVLRGSARRQAYLRLVTQLTRAAPFAVYGRFVWSEYFSPRVGCKVF